MRNIFDQYDEPENRLTHALACCLQEDRRLLRSFVNWLANPRPPSRHTLVVTEQSLPGDEEVTETELDQQRGLPDMWIHDHERWSLIIENKIGSAVEAGQIRRHRATALRRGFEDHSVVVISPDVPPRRSLAGASHVKWPDVYAWLLRNHAKSEWSRRLTSYMESAESRMIASGYLDRGSLTTFPGIRFGPDAPWNYREAKRLLRLAMEELRKNKKLQRFGMDPTGEGRPAITGREGSAVWDFLPIRQAKGTKNFTAYPHLTMGIQSKRVLVMVTVPNGIKAPLRRSLLSLGETGFEELALRIGSNLDRLLRKAKGAKPWMDVCQRHYLSQRSAPIEDARLEFDLRTVFPRKKKQRSVKPQPQWLRATYAALEAKRSNLQVGIGAIFPHSCSILHSKEALNYFAGTWLTCEPLLNVLLKGKSL
ncbi:MAG: hypothetical protein ABIG44_00765 [Planctomycetota bacterium]